jgi:uncharacterized phiE125 gp8 family phage protein
MPIKVITAPATMPVTLSEVKAFANVTISDDDTLLTSLLTAATAKAEGRTGRRFITQTLELYLDAFPGATGEINLPGPVASITSVKYVDVNGVEQTMAATDYVLDAVSNPARLVPAYEEEWPETREQNNAVVIRFITGASAADVPEMIKTYIKACVAWQYDNRDGDPFEKLVGLIDGYIVEFSV